MNTYRFDFTKGWNAAANTLNVLAKDVAQAVEFFNRYCRHNYYSDVEVKKIELICTANVHYTTPERKKKRR